MSKYYTWHDLELAFQLRGREGKWPSYIGRVNVFGDEAVITVTDQEVMNDQEIVWKQLREWFGDRFDRENQAFILDSFSDAPRTIQFEIEFEETVKAKQPLPLFGSFYNPQDIEYPELFQTGPKLFAFHSYKGGVGRTLSALSFCRSLSKHKKDGKPHRLLIIDADYEAPGITWLARKHGGFKDFSLFDALALVHEEANWEDEVLDFIVGKIQEDRLRIPAEEAVIEHFFLPAYRKEEQLLDIPVLPKHMIKFRNREWMIGDFLHKLGAKLGVDAVVVDLRAGVSEFSAPLLFDPRVQKVLVTTTSTQAVEGTRVILKEIMERLPQKQEYPLPFIFTSMVTEDAEGKMDRIEERYLELFNRKSDRQDDQTSEFIFDKTARIKRLQFDQQLVHLEDIEHIADKLSGTNLEKTIDKVVSQYFVDISKGEEVSKEQRDVVLKQMEELCTDLNEHKFETDLPFMKATHIRNLVQKFSKKLPAAVVMGSVGAGKTFNFLQIAKRQSWKNYVESVLDSMTTETDALIIPLYASERLSDFNKGMVRDCLVKSRSVLETSSNFDFSDVREKSNSLSVKENVTDTDWRKFWLEVVAEAVGYASDQEFSLGDINRFLTTKMRKVVFVMDGLSELFVDTFTNSSQKQAIRVLCKDSPPSQ